VSKKRDIEVEDHGNGFMVIGTLDPVKARKILKGYVKVKPYRFASPTIYDGHSACWLTTAAGEVWDGALDHIGNPIAR
jgi:hypothetical protein